MFLVKGDVMTLVPERPLAELKGVARGIKPGPLREKGVISYIGNLKNNG
jgi:hypothetical protein